jgi:hypothetical protein
VSSKGAICGKHFEFLLDEAGLNKTEFCVNVMVGLCEVVVTPVLGAASASLPFSLLSNSAAHTENAPE